MTAREGRKLMDLFGDLASDTASVRHRAGTLVVKYLIQAQGGALTQSPENLCADLEYSLKRLVRGLSSGRQSARQGFAACLCELLIVFSFITYHQVMTLLEDTTKITGGMKRAEERDILFGRLFGYLTLVNAGRVNASNASDISQRLVLLYAKKPWFHEAVIESLLSVLNQVNKDTAAIELVLRSIADADILYGDIGDMTASQLSLLVGLQHHFEHHPEGAATFQKMFNYKSSVSSLKRINTFAPALIESCSGYPKIHRVWHYMLSGIFPFDKDRQLSNNRVEALNPTQVKALHRFILFLEEHLLTSTREKRGVAMALIPLIASRIPTSLVNIGLSQAMVRCLVATRMNKKHTLYAVAGQAIESIVASATDPQTRLAMASTLVQHGSPSFDSRTSTQAISGLLAKTDAESVLAHVTSICGIIGSSLAALLNTPLCKPASEPQSKMRSADVTADSEGENDDSYSAVSLAISGLAELSALLKNNSFPGRSEVCRVSIAVLIRVACFSMGGANSLVDTKAVKSKKKTNSKKKIGNSSPDIFTGREIEAYLAFENPILAVGTPNRCVNLPSSVTNAAVGRLLSNVGDMGHIWLSKIGDLSDVGGPSFLDHCCAVLQCFIDAGGNLAFHGYGVGSTSLDSGNSEQEAINAVKNVLTAYSELSPGDPSTGTKVTTPVLRVEGTLRNLLGQGLLHVLTTTELSLQTLLSITDDKSKKLVTDDDAEEEDSVQLTLFEACIDLLSVPGDQHPIKGIREAIKKVWSSISSAYVVDYECAVGAVEFIAGEEGSAEGGDGAEYEGGDGELSEDESDSVSVDSEAEAIREAMLNANSTSGKKRKRDAISLSDDDTRYEEMNDAFARADDFGVLEDEDGSADETSGNDDSDSDDDGKILQHGEEADDALVNMLQLRKMNRKKGVLEAKRVQLLNRTRAIDILEVIISRNASIGYVVIPMFVPLLRCLRRCCRSTSIHSIQEGRVFENKLKSLFDSRLCKERFRLSSAEDDDELRAEIDDSVAEAIQYSFRLLNCTESTVRYAASNTFLALCRAIISSLNDGVAKHSSSDVPLKSALDAAVQSAFDQLFNKKNSRIPVKFFHDMIDRFPDFLCSQIVSQIASACSEAKSSFLRSEACKLLHELIKRFKVLSEPCRCSLFNVMSDVLYSTANGLLSLSMDNTDSKAKRLRPVMELSKDILKLINEQSALELPCVEERAIIALRQLTDTESPFVSSSKSSVVKRLAREVSTLLAEVSATSKGTNKKNVGSSKSNKRSLSDTGEEIITKTLQQNKNAKKARKK